MGLDRHRHSNEKMKLDLLPCLMPTKGRPTHTLCYCCHARLLKEFAGLKWPVPDHASHTKEPIKDLPDLNTSSSTAKLLSEATFCSLQDTNKHSDIRKVILLKFIYCPSMSS